MTNKISHSALRTYSECARRYKFHYIERLRPKVIHGALLFGNALDIALNSLLEDKDLTKAIAVFEKAWSYQYINDVGQPLAKNINIVYSETDYDGDLLKNEDILAFTGFAEENKYAEKAINFVVSELKDKKKEVGVTNLSSLERQLLNYGHWLSLLRKGHVMLNAYAEKVLPKIKNVLAIQKRISLSNDAGDTINGVVDLIVELKDGKRYIMDNKTSSRVYDSDSAMRSQQLIIYYHDLKDEFKLDGVGFIVIYKNINKNKEKVCSKCKHSGTGKSHRTCDNMIEGKRCQGEWNVTCNPDCFIDIITNPITKAAEDLVLEAFDEANDAIKNKVFNPNLNACKNGSLACPYFQKCWFGDDSELTKLPSKSEK